MKQEINEYRSEDNNVNLIFWNIPSLFSPCIVIRIYNILNIKRHTHKHTHIAIKEAFMYQTEKSVWPFTFDSAIMCFKPCK